MTYYELVALIASIIRELNGGVDKEEAAKEAVEYIAAAKNLVGNE